MTILVVDNYDSFTYNLVQYLSELGADVLVHRNDDPEVSLEAVRKRAPAGVLISPGPGTPDDAGETLSLIAGLEQTPILGVCLGHQSIGQHFGASVVRASRLMHGRTSKVSHDGRGVFAGLPTPFTATRYHSLIVDPATVPECLEVTARVADPDHELEEIMGLKHKTRPIEGVQFHPESFLTEHGHAMLQNWLDRLSGAA